MVADRRENINIMDDEVSYKEIKNELQELARSTITLDNYKKFYDKVSSKSTLIVAQVESFKSNYQDIRDRIADITKVDRFKRGYEDGYVPAEVYDLQERMLKIIFEAFSWKVMELEINTIFTKKMYQLIDDVNAFEIQKDALREMKDMEEKRNKMHMDLQKSTHEMFKEMMSSQLKLNDQKVTQSMRIMQEHMRQERNEMVTIIRQLIENKPEIELVLKKKPLEPSMERDNIINKEVSDFAPTREDVGYVPPKKKIGRPRKDEDEDEDEDEDSEVESLFK